MACYRPYASTDVSGMVMDCQAYLAQSTLLRLARRKTKRKTGDEETMLVVWCEPASTMVTLEDIAAELERIWLNDLRFTEEAHAIIRSDEDVVLAFVTWWPETTGSYVTGQIVVNNQLLTAASHNVASE